MAKVFEKVLESLQALADERKAEIHSQAEVTRCEDVVCHIYPRAQALVDLSRALKSSPVFGW